MATPPSEAERAAISRIVGQGLVDASGRTHHSCKEAVVFCCGHEADLAHKIQSQMDKQRDMLIANLMAMR
jgi:hypothetical protein